MSPRWIASGLSITKVRSIIRSLFFLRFRLRFGLLRLLFLGGRFALWLRLLFGRFDNWRLDRCRFRRYQLHLRCLDLSVCPGPGRPPRYPAKMDHVDVALVRIEGENGPVLFYCKASQYLVRSSTPQKEQILFSTIEIASPDG